MKRMGALLLTFLTGFYAKAGDAPLPKSCSFFEGREVSLRDQHPFTDYQVKIRQCQLGQTQWVGLREFQSSGQTYLLIANPQTLQTQIVDRSCLECQDTSLEKLSDSNYKTSWSLQQQAPFPFMNKGLVHARKGVKGYFLSVDLCPSHKNFESEIFENAKVRTEENFPVAIAISGGWMRHYQDNLRWLKEQQLDGHLQITWVNHSFTHPYEKTLPDDKNFLLLPGVVFSDEVIKQEQFMIESGLTPSVYFRFPGLVSSQKLIQDLSNYGLIALGADAWLALDEKPTQGSIILIHGNGNEPYGIRLFMDLLKNISDMSIFKPLNEIFK